MPHCRLHGLPWDAHVEVKSERTGSPFSPALAVTTCPACAVSRSCVTITSLDSVAGHGLCSAGNSGHPEISGKTAACRSSAVLATYRYCRIIAADVLACLATHEVLAGVVADSQAVQPLVELLHLQHSPGVSSPTAPCLCSTLHETEAQLRALAHDVSHQDNQSHASGPFTDNLQL